ncbi:glucose-6-phosphate isomerase [Fusobacterium necrophorum]|uniref:glucose-6-phosphate isomerase n=1 Tax=Fusobacterium necrophorum TaxID=859 RepID=UPI00370F2C1D
MKSINFDWKTSAQFISEEEIENIKAQIILASNLLENGTGAGKEFLGWLSLPTEYDKEEFIRIQQAAEKIKQQSEVLIVIGIGGSYLGARAVIECLSHTFYNNLTKEKRNFPEIYFVGHNISGRYIKHLLEIIGERSFSLNVISKSGTTTEPAIAFRIFKKKLEEKYGKEEAKNRIFATTDVSKGALKSLAIQEGYETFVIPDNVGGRFSVFTAVGLLPIAVAGISIEEFMKGAKDAQTEYSKDFEENICYQYAAIRNILYRKNISIELLVNYDPRFHFIAEWWKQLFGESEGKDEKGLFPAAVDLSTDLHSMGQYIQDGKRILMETVLQVECEKEDIILGLEKEDLDGLNYLSGKSMHEINQKAFSGTLLAHIDGGVPNFVITLPEVSAYYIGKLLYFFEKACGVSGYLLGVNPFNQPGVESYKRNMFALLGKKGYENLSEELEKRLKK